MGFSNVLPTPACMLTGTQPPLLPYGVRLPTPPTSALHRWRKSASSDFLNPASTLAGLGPGMAVTEKDPAAIVVIL